MDHTRREARTLSLGLRDLNGKTILVRLFVGNRNPEIIGAPILADIGGRSAAERDLRALSFPAARS